MGKRDPYRVLGVSRSATGDEIKKAYRRLARKHHPDLNANSKAAEDRFKEVSDAYDILSDKEKRHRYDRFGHDGLNPNFSESSGWEGFTDSGFGQSGYRFNFGGFTSASGNKIFEDILSDYFKGPGRRTSGEHRASRGSDLEHSLTIDFDQAYHGVTAVVRILHRKINVHIPPGVDTGSRIRLAGQGAPGLRGGPSGDLFLDITVVEHPVFRRTGKDVHMVLPISIGEAIRGARVEIPGPGGRLALKIPGGTQSGTSFRFKGKGFPSLKDEGGTGDFYVTVHIYVPETIDSVSRDLMAEFDRRNPVNPREGLWKKIG
ncbi:MAG: DnaJ domain-containing protein [Desulfomonile tiedjei]|nr:DnaJ domain-containing protein [Desulfomonile tiedjei]